MKYCFKCGCKLENRYLNGEGEIPFCPTCNEFRFPIFSTAVSMVILSSDKTKVLLVKQYGKDFNRLVAGYVNKGESAEEALVREMAEEVGLIPTTMKFQLSKYFPKSNTLLFNFVVTVDSMDVKANEEIDSYAWYNVDDGLKALSGATLAKEFYRYFIDHYEDY